MPNRIHRLWPVEYWQNKKRQFMAGSSGNIIRACSLCLLATIFIISVAAGVYTSRPSQEARHIPLRPMPARQIMPAKVAPDEPSVNANTPVPVKPGEQAEKTAQAKGEAQVSVQAQEVKQAEKIQHTPSKTFAPQNWPVSGAVIHEFGWQQHPLFKDWRFHTGIDLQVESGQPVASAISGIVTDVEESPKTGLTVKIASGPWLVHHGTLSSVLVKAGDKVEAGQTLGKAGQSAQEPYPHVHLTIEKDGKFINPGEVLPSR